MDKKQIDQKIAKITAEISELGAAALAKTAEINKLKNLHEFRDYRVIGREHGIDSYGVLIRLEDEVNDMAAAACEGSHNRGSSQYDINFIDIDGTRKTATFEVQYDRHDKTYYYVDKVSLKSVVETAN